MTLITSLEQAGEGSLADLIDRLTLYEHREGYDGKDWEKIASEAAGAIRALHADKAMLTGQLQASRAMLAASTPVECPSNLQKVQSATPPSVSIGNGSSLRDTHRAAEAAVLAIQQCKYCGPGVQTGLPGNACENCMGTGEDLEGSAWTWVQSRYPNDAASDLAFDANEMVDAYMAGASATPQPADGCSSNEGAGT